MRTKWVDTYEALWKVPAKYNVPKTLCYLLSTYYVSDPELTLCGRGCQLSIKHMLPFRSIELS